MVELTGNKLYGRLRRKWIDCVKDSVEQREVSKNDESSSVYDQAAWRTFVKNGRNQGDSQVKFQCAFKGSGI